MAKKLVISDLDGTLLDNPRNLSSKYIEKLNELIDEGLNFTIATGRDLKNTKKAIDGLKIKFPVILTNGALLADLNTNKFLKITHIEKNIVYDIIKIAKDNFINPIVFIAYDSISETMHFSKGKWGKKYNPPILLEDNQFLPYQDLKVVSMQFHSTKEKLDELKEIIYRKYEGKTNLIYIEDVSYKHEGIEGDWYWLEINSSEAGKDKMLKYLCEYLNYDLQDVVFFGDNHNDREIMQVAGKSIAVSNAANDLKKLADEVCENNREGGVINYIVTNKEELIY